MGGAESTDISCTQWDTSIKDHERLVKNNIVTNNCSKTDYILRADANDHKVSVRLDQQTSAGDLFDSECCVEDPSKLSSGTGTADSTAGIGSSDSDTGASTAVSTASQTGLKGRSGGGGRGGG